MHDREYTLDDFDFHLPEHLIAQYPPPERDDSRLFVLDRKKKRSTHSSFSSIQNFLKKGDLLVFNNARVISARIPCRRKSGGSLQLTLTSRLSPRSWMAISNRTKRINPGEELITESDPGIKISILERIGDQLKLDTSIELTETVLTQIGELALPPYIKRKAADIDTERYQTIYATESGAVAAPTAGLHFTDELLNRIRAGGVKTCDLTLFVSWGTFQPVRSVNIKNHVMHTEQYILDEETAGKINSSRREGNRIVAVGTTSLRVLESTFMDGRNISGSGETDIFLHPPRKIESSDALITNFHTPRSTLLMLVAAFAGYETIMDAYAEAVKKEYRFFSYGDAMFIQ